MRRRMLLTFVAALALAACSKGGTGANPPAGGSSSGGSSTGGTTSGGTSSGGQGAQTVNIDKCFSQEMAPGLTVQDFLIHDQLRIDLTRPAGFPNGRRLQDPVVDLTLAYLFLDLNVHRLDDLAKVSVNPAANDKQFRPDFPFLADPFGTVPAPGTGSNFSFRTNPDSDYVRVDIMGVPAESTVLISGNAQANYNDQTPETYSANGGAFLSNYRQTLLALGGLLKDDFDRLGFVTCATVS